MCSIAQPAIAAEFVRSILAVVVDGIELDEIISTGAVKGQRILTIGSGVVQLDKGADIRDACDIDNVAIATGSAIHRQFCTSCNAIIDPIKNPDRVAIVAGVDVHRAIQPLDLHLIAAGVGVDMSRSGKRTVQNDLIGTGSG